MISAVVWPLTSMNAHVCFEVALLVECAAAARLRAYKFLFSFMCFLMHFQPQLPCICLAAPGEGAFEWLFFDMCLQMIVQMPFRHEGLVTACYCAWKWSN